MKHAPPNTRNLEARLVLDLLDDQPKLKPSNLDWSPRLNFPATATRAVAQKSTALLAKPTASPKIIRTSRTLKDMMNEYNRTQPATYRYRDTVESPTLRSERVERIILPKIPGKILRPT